MIHVSKRNPDNKQEVNKMTYMILVNGEYMVKIDHDGSLGGAEHYILDNFPGCEGALAFGEKEIATKWFVRDYLSNAEVISIEELARMSKAYEEACLTLSDAENKKAEKSREVREMKEALAKLEQEEYELEKAVIACRIERKNARQVLGNK